MSILKILSYISTNNISTQSLTLILTTIKLTLTLQLNLHDSALILHYYTNYHITLLHYYQIYIYYIITNCIIVYRYHFIFINYFNLVIELLFKLVCLRIQFKNNFFKRLPTSNVPRASRPSMHKRCVTLY